MNEGLEGDAGFGELPGVGIANRQFGPGLGCRIARRFRFQISC